MVDNAKIIDKMIRELESAKENKESQQVMLKHIGNVQLLCELFLEEEPKASSPSSSFTEQEMKVMLGEGYSGESNKGPKKLVEHDGANGESIFDF